MLTGNSYLLLGKRGRKSLLQCIAYTVGHTAPPPHTHTHNRFKMYEGGGEEKNGCLIFFFFFLLASRPGLGAYIVNLLNGHMYIVTVTIKKK